jgi:hypothetical protein
MRFATFVQRSCDSVSFQEFSKNGTYGHTVANNLRWSKEACMRRHALLFVIAFGVFALARCHAVTATTTQTLTASIGALAKVSVPSGQTLSPTGTFFSPFTASMTMNYRARTTASGGGNITAKATADFTPSGGPSVPSGQLTYSCPGATLGTACSATQTVSTTSATGIVTLPVSACTGGGAPCSTADPNSVSLEFSLTNSPASSTGTYQVTLQFTASAI